LALQALEKPADCRISSFPSARRRPQAGKPGRSLWSVPALQGKSIGGDRFGNYEKQLPKGQWQEADLNYKGGKRGANRLVFSRPASALFPSIITSVLSRCLHASNPVPVATHHVTRTVLR
jgi:hypothetical protein